MQESLFYANQELKRAEHLLYVSLKYTRTGDVIRSLVARLIACIDYLLDGLLRREEEKNSIAKMPDKPFTKIVLLKKLYEKDYEMLAYLDFYLLLRKLYLSKGEATKEFRRNLTLHCVVDDKKVQITIDICGDYYHKTVDFLHYIKKLYFVDKEK